MNLQDGLLGMLVNSTVDIVLNGYVQTQKRSEYIDFTKPIYNMRFNILVRRTEDPTVVGHYLKPLTDAVWMSSIGSVLAVAAVLVTVLRDGF